MHTICALFFLCFCDFLKKSDYYFVNFLCLIIRKSYCIIIYTGTYIYILYIDRQKKTNTLLKYHLFSLDLQNMNTNKTQTL
jgi:hypothetical protein